MPGLPFRDFRAPRSRASSALIALGFALGSVAAQAQSVVGDAKRGETLFAACSSCHDIGHGAQNRDGPSLNGLIGARVGEREGFASSLPMVSAGLRGLIWSEQILDIYLADPSDLVSGSDSPFIGIDEARDRADIIAYIVQAGAVKNAPR